MKLFKRFFNREQKVWNAEAIDLFFEEKSQALPKVLGEQMPSVGHAIVGFNAGGTVDMYYFQPKEGGTLFATEELIRPTGEKSIRNENGYYELVALTKQSYQEVKIGEGPFGEMERRMCGIFTGVARFSYQAKLEPLETCEFPVEGEESRCLIFDSYKGASEFVIEGESYGLLLIIEVFRQEMEYARKQGTRKLIELLKEKGHYPFSDLNREPVV